MTDRELLELAAKAAGIDGYYDTGVIWYKNSFGDDAGFNPLNSDGDALRLAVRLRLEVSQGYDEGSAAYVGYPANNMRIHYLAEQIGNDPYAATRRAIVRAAAEIARIKGRK